MAEPPLASAGRDGHRAGVSLRSLFVHLAWMVAVSVLGAAGSAWLHPRAPAFREAVYDAGGITVAAARALPGEVLWVDARERHEYEAGHLPGALLLNESEWSRLLGEFLLRWQPGMTVVVYCGSEACPAARSVRARLAREAGIEEAVYLRGGLEAWRRADTR